MPRSWQSAAVSRLVVARLKAGLSQSEAARLAGVSQPFWHQVEAENRRPSYEVLERMLAAVGLSLEPPKVT